MPKSGHLRVEDSHALWRLLGDCRDLGDDRVAWRERLNVGLADLIDADILFNGEVAEYRQTYPRDLGLSFWWRSNSIVIADVDAYIQEHQINPSTSTTLTAFHEKNRKDDGLALRRSDFLDDRNWYKSDDFKMLNQIYGGDAAMWCFRQIDSATSDDSSGFLAMRDTGRPDFTARERLILREANRFLATMIGGQLARFSDPSPADLPSRPRRVLACILEGDADKQIASRLGLSRYTVNDHTKTIYRHFAVKSRTELLARWIRRGWGNQAHWVETESYRSQVSGYSSSWSA